jgi:hypothetical protein
MLAESISIIIGGCRRRQRERIKSGREISHLRTAAVEHNSNTPFEMLVVRSSLDEKMPHFALVLDGMSLGEEVRVVGLARAPGDCEVLLIHTVSVVAHVDGLGAALLDGRLATPTAHWLSEVIGVAPCG